MAKFGLVLFVSCTGHTFRHHNHLILIIGHYYTTKPWSSANRFCTENVKRVGRNSQQIMLIKMNGQAVTTLPNIKQTGLPGFVVYNNANALTISSIKNNLLFYHFYCLTFGDLLGKVNIDFIYCIQNANIRSLIYDKCEFI